MNEFASCEKKKLKRHPARINIICSSRFPLGELGFTLFQSLTSVGHTAINFQLANVLNRPDFSLLKFSRNMLEIPIVEIKTTFGNEKENMR